MSDLVEFIKNHFVIFDLVFILIIIYNIFKSFTQGFSLSFLTSLKWIVAAIATIIFVPQLQPWVNDYIQSDFINNVGIGIVVFILTLFLSILIGKGLGKTVKWSGLGSVDKSFGLLFGLVKGYIVSVCLFSLLNWFYPYDKWGIATTDAYSFSIVKKGSELLIDEFPNYKEIIDTKEKIEKI